MEITEVRVKLVNTKDDRLKAFCSITLDNEFVVRDIKVVEGSEGPFVAMPSRKMSDHCDKCGGKNHLKAGFCNDCGASLAEARAKGESASRRKFHIDIVHPISTKCRHKIQDKVRQAFAEEVERSKKPGYKAVEIGELDDNEVTEAV